MEDEQNLLDPEVYSEPRAIRLVKEKVRYSVKTALGMGGLQRQEADYGRQVIHSLEAAFVRFATDGATVSVRWPATWWEHVKFDFAGKASARLRWVRPWKLQAWIQRQLAGVIDSVRMEERSWNAWLFWANYELPPEVKPGDVFTLWHQRPLPPTFGRKSPRG